LPRVSAWNCICVFPIHVFMPKAVMEPTLRDGHQAVADPIQYLSRMHVHGHTEECARHKGLKEKKAHPCGPICAWNSAPMCVRCRGRPILCGKNVGAHHVNLVDIPPGAAETHQYQTQRTVTASLSEGAESISYGKYTLFTDMDCSAFSTHPASGQQRNSRAPSRGPGCT
jgi:hypothetical protein